jgi:hypothetical protein
MEKSAQTIENKGSRFRGDLHQETLRDCCCGSSGRGREWKSDLAQSMVAEKSLFVNIITE